MKKNLIVTVALMFSLALTHVNAGTTEAKPAMTPVNSSEKHITAKVDSPDKWDFFQFGFWFDIPSAITTSNVYGIKIGAPFCAGQGTVKGIETAVFCGATDNITGLQACILTSVSKQLEGLQFSIVNYAEEVDGLQLGVVNIARKSSFQLGIINYIEDAPIPLLPVINFKF